MKAQYIWGVVVRVLVKVDATVWARSMLYKAVVHKVLIYNRDGWVVTDVILKVMEGVHHRLFQSIVGISAQRFGLGGWQCPLVVDFLGAAGRWPIK